MKIRLVDQHSLAVEMTLNEARHFYEELADIPGSSRLTKVRQVCRELEVSLGMVDAAVAEKKKS